MQYLNNHNIILDIEHCTGFDSRLMQHRTYIVYMG